MNKEFSKSGSITVIQLNRFGDLIQSYLALSGIKELNPNIELNLIAREQFCSDLKFLLQRVFTNIYTIEDFKDCSENDLQKKLLHQLEGIAKSRQDVCVNLSFCKASEIIAKIISCKHHIGPYRNNSNETCIDDPWGQFVYSNVLDSKLCPFNLVDIFKKMLGNTFPTPLAENKGSRKTNNIILHPFASDSKKKWGMSKWAEVISQLLCSQPNLKIHIVGSNHEISQSNHLLKSPNLEKLKDRVISHVGDLDIQETLELLEKANLFIGNDSMVSHLCAITQTPSLTISLGPVKHHETAPYQLEHITITPKISCYPCSVTEKCDLLPCHGKIRPQLISHIACHVLEKGTYDDLSLGGIGEHNWINANIYSNFFEDNKFVLRKVDSLPYTIEQFFLQIYEIIWTFILEDRDTKVDYPHITEGTTQSLLITLNGLEKAFQLYQHAILNCSKLSKILENKNPSMLQVQELTKRILEIDELFQILSSNFPLLRPVINFFYVKKLNAHEGEMLKIVNTNLVVYQQAAQALSIMLDLINKSLEHHQKPNTTKSNSPKQAL